MEFCFAPPHSFISHDINKADFCLAITLTWISVWKMRNEKVFQQIDPNFHNNMEYLRKSFKEFKKCLSTLENSSAKTNMQSLNVNVQHSHW